MIEAMLWDLRGVLCRSRPERRIVEIARRCGRSPATVEAFLDRPLLDALDRGELDGAGLHTRARHRLGWDCSHDDLAAAWATAFEPNRDVLGLAARVDLPAGLLTDNGPPHADQFTRRLPEVASVVQVAVFSAEIGYTAPWSIPRGLPAPHPRPRARPVRRRQPCQRQRSPGDRTPRSSIHVC